jgi:uncharacterized RDD family membrane protein YckC
LASSSSSSPEAGERPVEYVGFWKRVVAALIDTLIVLVVSVPLLLAVYGTGYFARARNSGGFAGVWDFLVQVVLPAVAVIVFWKFRGATPGKMAISARIVDARTSASPSTGQLVGRYFGYFVSILPLGLGLIWVGIDRRKQGFHDKLANTMVIYDDDDHHGAT